MDNVPKIVRERMKVTGIVADHPDADLLTAFAERSLRETERATVMEHLARCGECRDVVALALPAIEAVETRVAPDRSTWLAWPALRWGLALAGLAVIASLSIVHLQRHTPAMTAYQVQPASTEARNETLPAVASPQSPAEQTTKLVPSAAGKTSHHEKARARDEFAPVPPPPAAEQPNHQAMPTASVPPAAQAVEAQASSAPAIIYRRGEQKVGRAKEPSDTSAVHPERAMAAGARAANADFAFAPTARWLITPAGGLQRSLDQGQSWQDVNVKASAAPAAQNSFEAQSSSTPDATGNSPIVFRAVAANGPEVWAGASAGQLYHSTDSGTHWTEVVPSAGNAVLTGDVVSLEFVDAQHGRVSTSTSEVWVTADDGVTWQKQ